MNQQLTCQPNVYTWTFERLEDGAFDIPSLSYASNTARHFSCDDSGFVDEADMFLQQDGTYSTAPVHFACLDQLSEIPECPGLFQLAYESYDYFHECLAVVQESKQPNAHAVTAWCMLDAEGKPVSITLQIFWYGF